MEKVRHLMTMMRRGMLFLLLIVATLPSHSGGVGGGFFFNLTADEVRIDTLLPVFNYAYPLDSHYADSTYEVSIEYPEFVPMSAEEIERYQAISREQLGMSHEDLPALPVIHQSISVERKKGTLHIGFIPLVYRDGQYQKLVSFKLDVRSKMEDGRRRASDIRHQTSAVSRYADNSVLRSGTWAKIRVPVTGIYQLTSDLIKKAGFNDINKVKVYGYGGARQPEQLTADYLAETDDLKEVPTCTVNGRRFFYAVGPVSWDANYRRIRNNYSDYGYYFLTENDSTALTIEKDAFISSCYPQRENYCTLYEVDDYAWYHGGRNLYDATEIKAGASKAYTIAAKGTGNGQLTIVLSAIDGASITVSLNGESLGTVNIIKQGEYDAMQTASRSFSVSNLQARTSHYKPEPSCHSSNGYGDYHTHLTKAAERGPTTESPARTARLAARHHRTCRRALQRILEWYT